MKKIITLYCLMIVFYPTGMLFAQNITNALQQLNAKSSFADFSLKITKHEKQNLENISIKNRSPYDNYGNLEGMVVDLTLFFQSMNNDYNTSLQAAKSIHKIIKKIKQDLKSESFWMTIRVFNSSNDFDLPRWHQDGYYYAPFSGFAYKIALTLKGPSTLFYNIPTKDRKEFYKIFCCKTIEQKFRNAKGEYEQILTLYGDSKDGRKELDKLVDHSKIYQPPACAGAVFIVGDKDTAAIHSEPSIHEDRIFISIVPGTADQINEWKNKCEK